MPWAWHSSAPACLFSWQFQYFFKNPFYFTHIIYFRHEKARAPCNPGLQNFLNNCGNILYKSSKKVGFNKNKTFFNPFIYGLSDQCLGMEGPKRLRRYMAVLRPFKANLCYYQVICISWGLSVTIKSKFFIIILNLIE